MNPNYPSGTTSDLSDTANSGLINESGDTLQSTAQNTYSEGNTNAAPTGASLRTELSNLKSDLDTLLSRANTMSDNELSVEHARLMAKFSSVKSAARGMAAQGKEQFSRMASQGKEQFTRLSSQANEQFTRLSAQANEQFTHGKEVTVDYVKEKPLQSVAAAAGVGLVLGMLLKR